MAQDDYGLGPLAREMNLVAAQIARAACDKYSTPDKPRFVAGALGITGRDDGRMQPCKTALLEKFVNRKGQYVSYAKHRAECAGARPRRATRFRSWHGN